MIKRKYLLAIVFFTYSIGEAQSYPLSFKPTGCSPIAKNVAATEEKSDENLASPDEIVDRDTKDREKILRSSPTPRDLLTSEHIWANRRAPQMNGVLRLRLASAFLTHPLDALEMIKKPTSKEIEIISEEMNKAHKSCRVSYRTVGHPELRTAGEQKVFSVNNDRMSSILESANRIATNGISSAAQKLLTHYLGGHGAVMWMNAIEDRNNWNGSALLINQVFESKETEKVAEDLYEIGIIIKDVLLKPKISLRFGDYHKLIRQTMDASVPQRKKATTESNLDRSDYEHMTQDFALKRFDYGDVVMKEIQADLVQAISKARPDLAPLAKDLVYLLVKGTG